MRYVRDESMVPIAIGGSNDSGVRWTWLGSQDVHRMGVKQPEARTAGRDIVSGDRSPSGSMDDGGCSRLARVVRSTASERPRQQRGRLSACGDRIELPQLRTDVVWRASQLRIIA
jgi:hypothetical protein